MWKQHQVVMLATNQTTNIILDKNILEIIKKPQIASTINSDVKGFNLYILSDDEIKVDGGWYYNTITKALFVMKYHTLYD